MKLLRFGPPGQERPAVLADGTALDVRAVTPDYDSAFFARSGMEELRARVEDGAGLFGQLDLGGSRIGPPVARPPKIVCIGLNYADHAKESGVPLPKEPVIFNKAPSCICGPDDDTMMPKGGTKLDYEIELGIVIGSRARYLSKSNAMDAVAGYCLANDVSERAFQHEHDGQWTKGKSSETFGPLGPWLVTKDEIKDPQNLDLRLTVNGETRQKGSTKTMVFDCAYLVWYCSQFMVLEPGDVIVTGTPPGVAMGMKPEPKYLKVGDIVRLSIPELGEQTQKVVKFRM